MSKIKYVGKCLLVEEEGKRALVLGDLHIGFEEELNRAGVFIIRKMTDDYIQELGKIKEVVGSVDMIIILGDLKHGFGSISNQEWNESRRVFETLRKFSERIIVVKGNHDILTPQLVKREKVELCDHFILGDSLFAHGDRDFKEMWEKKVKRIIIGHTHPAVRISDKVKDEKYKCFLQGAYKRKKFTIVPSFVEYNIGTDPREFQFDLPWEINLDKFEVIVVESETTNLNFGKLKNIFRNDRLF